MRTLFKDVPKGNISFNKNSTGIDTFLNETYKFYRIFFKNECSRTDPIPAYEYRDGVIVLGVKQYSRSGSYGHGGKLYAVAKFVKSHS